MSGQLNQSIFENHINESFRISQQPDGNIDLMLEKIDAGKSDGGDDECFSIIFQGPADSCLPQKVYSLKHTKLGTFPLFIVPVAKNENGYRYEAVFNRRKS